MSRATHLCSGRLTCERQIPTTRSICGPCSSHYSRLTKKIREWEQDAADEAEDREIAAELRAAGLV